MSNGKGLSVHPLTREESINQTKRERSRKTVRKRKGTGCNRECCKSPSEDSFWEALQFEASVNTHLKSEGNLEQVGQSQMPMEGILALARKLPSEKKKYQTLTSELGEFKIQRQISVSERDPDRQQKRKIFKSTTVRPKVYRVD